MSYLAESERERERERESQNGHISLFGKICSILPLFEKYFAIYHFFGTRVSQTQVWQVTQVSKFIKKRHLELEFHKLKFLVHKVQLT